MSSLVGVCVGQVASGGGGTLSRRVELRVLVPEAFILGAEEYHVDAGSAITLVCIIENVDTKYDKLNFYLHVTYTCYTTL